MITITRTSAMTPTQWFFFRQIAALFDEHRSFYMDDMTLLVGEDFVLARWPGWQSDVYLDLFLRWGDAVFIVDPMRIRKVVTR